MKIKLVALAERNEASMDKCMRSVLLFAKMTYDTVLGAFK